jgi:poly(3-hydroxybutyrate) depolymerase
MLYQLYEMNNAALWPARLYADMTRLFYQSPFNPLSRTALGRSVAAGAELFERATRRYGKPSFGLDSTVVDRKPVPVVEKTVWSRPFCNLIHFEREIPAGRKPDPKLLIVAPMSGHHATLLRGTVEAMLPHAEVHITDWTDARDVPVSAGTFDLDDYIDYVIEMLHALGPDTHVMAVCQPSVPVLAAAALMEARGDRFAPSTMTLMGGPIDTRCSPTAVDMLAEEKGIDWFREHVIMQASWPSAGFGRDVYPGFLQLSGFIGMNLDRHIEAHKKFFQNLVKNDGDSATKHREFYDEYLAVMDLTAEFYLQTVDTVFVRQALPKGEMTHRGVPVDPAAIRNVALFTVEGENDDISGLGQTKAAHDLCVNIPADMKAHYMQPDVGHYGVFNGSRFRAEIVPRIVDFIGAHGRQGKAEIKPKAARAAKVRA